MPSIIKQKIIMNFGTKRESSVDGSFFVRVMRTVCLRVEKCRKMSMNLILNNQYMV